MQYNIRQIVILTAILSFCVFPASAQRATTTDTDPPPFLRVVEGPKYRVEAFKEGNTKEGHLYFEVVLENVTNYIVKAGASFTLYLKDGTRHSGCYAPGGNGAGVYFSVAPREKVLVQCSRSIVPVDLPGDKVTMRLWDYRRFSKPRSAPVEIIETGLTPAKEEYMKGYLDAFVRLRSLAKTDIKVHPVFRYYDADNIQVGECEPGAVKLESEVVLKTSCEWFRVSLARKPATVKAEFYLVQ